MKHTLSPLREQEAGMGHILVIALVVVVIAVIGAAGYEVSQKNNRVTVRATIQGSLFAELAAGVPIFTPTWII